VRSKEQSPRPLALALVLALARNLNIPLTRPSDISPHAVHISVRIGMGRGGRAASRVVVAVRGAYTREGQLWMASGDEFRFRGLSPTDWSFDHRSNRNPKFEIRNNIKIAKVEKLYGRLCRGSERGKR
jgi:hypothetical protein